MLTFYRLEGALLKAGLGPVAGADEVGRGACAGPLVAAAVILSDSPRRRIEGLADSKKITATKRTQLSAVIRERAVAWTIVTVPASECDRLGIQEANLQALRRALCRVAPAAHYALIDGYPVAGTGMPSLAVWKGDQVSASVAAASILAKVARDTMMVEAHEHYPEYGFAAHKGYATAAHQRSLDMFGPCAIHRMSYANVAKSARLATP